MDGSDLGIHEPRSVMSDEFSEGLYVHNVCYTHGKVIVTDKATL